MDFNFPRESNELKDRCRSFCETELMEISKKYGETSNVPYEMIKEMAEKEIFKYLIPEEYGGKGVKAVNICIIREELSKVYVHADVTFAMQGLGSYPIVILGTEIQKKKYLERIGKGELLTTFALTEPDAGSDVSSIKTWAERRGQQYIINGIKRFISNGNCAHIAIVFARTQNKDGISAFILEKGINGFKVKRSIDLIAPHDIVEFQFEDCEVSLDFILGSEGEGLEIARKTLDLFRMSVGASAVGMAQAAFDASVEYSKNRVQFGKPISKFQAISFKLAEMATDIEAARLLVYRAAFLRDEGIKDFSKEASMAKFFATEMAQRVIDQSLQIFGGLGVTKGNIAERLYREVRAMRIYEGTTEIQKLIIANKILKR